MSIRVLFHASLAEITGLAETEVEAGEFADVASIFARFLADHPRLAAHRDSLLYAVNREFAQPQTRVEDGDEVAFLPPVSGG